MSTGGNEYTLSVKLNVTNLAEVRKQIASLGEGAVGGGTGAGGRGVGAGPSAASAPGYGNAAATTAAATAAATSSAPAVTQAALRQRANLAINTAIGNVGYIGGLTTMEAITQGKMFPELSEAAQLGIRNRAVVGESGMAVRAAQARLEIAKAMRSGGLFGKAEQLNRLAGDQSYSPSQRLGFATQLEATLDKIEARTAREEERRQRQEAARERAQQRAEERRAREEERQRRREEARERAQKRAEERQARSNATAEERLKRAREGVAVSRATAEGGLFGRANTLYGFTQDPSIPEMRRLGYEKQLHQTMARIERSTSAYERQQASIAGEPPGPTTPVGASSGSAPRGGGFRAAARRFFGPPSLMNLYFSAVFGGWELSQARSRIAVADMAAQAATDPISRMQAELQAAVAGFQGPIGGLVGEVMDAIGIGGHSFVQQNMLASINYETARLGARQEALKTNVARAGAGSSRFSVWSQYSNAVKVANAQYKLDTEQLEKNITEMKSRLEKNEDAIKANTKEEERYAREMEEANAEFTSAMKTGGVDYMGVQMLSRRRVAPIKKMEVMDSRVEQALKFQVESAKSQIERAEILRQETIRPAAEEMRASVFKQLRQAEIYRINAEAQGSSVSSSSIYRKLREVEKKEMLFGRVAMLPYGGIFMEPGLAELFTAFNAETEATAGRMKSLRDLEISRYQTNTRMNNVISDSIMAGKPYDAARQRALSKYYEAINRAEGIQDDELKQKMKEKAGSDLGVDIAQIEKELANRKEQIRINQTTRAGQMTALENRREYGARVIGIGGSAIASARGFLNEGLMDEARNEALLGIRQVNLARRDYLEAFRGAQFDVRNIGMSDRDTEDIEGTLNDIHQTIQELMKVVENLAAN